MLAARIWRPETMLLISRIYIRFWNVTVLYPLIDSANWPWPTNDCKDQAGASRSDSAGFGRSQKDGLPSRPRGQHIRFKAIDSRERGRLVAAPFGWGREWTPRRSILLSSPRCRCSAQCSLGQGTVVLLASSFLRSV